MAAFREVYLRSLKLYINTIATTIGGVGGVAVANLDIVIPQNYMMRILRASVFSNSTGTPTLEIFADNNVGSWRASNWAPDRTRRQHYALNGKNDPGDFNQPPMFDEGEIPLFYWSGGTVGDICQACCLCAYYEKEPMITHRSLLGLSHQERVEDAQRATTPRIAAAAWNLGNIETPDDMIANGYWPWAASQNPSEQPADYTPDAPEYVAGNDLGAQHPKAPWRGRVLADHSMDQKDQPE